MSEPLAGFMRVTLGAEALEEWLRGSVPMTSAWVDWRSYPGEWYGDNGIVSMVNISQEDLAKLLAECDERLALFATNERVLEAILSHAEEPGLRLREYDAEARTLSAGTLTYGENVGDFLFFLTVMRGCAKLLEAEDAGLVVVADCLWNASDDEDVVALGLGAGGVSEWLGKEEAREAAKSFQGRRARDDQGEQLLTGAGSMARKVSVVCGVAALLCFVAAVVIDNSDEKYDWQTASTLLGWCTFLLPIIAAILGSKKWLLVWLLLVGWLLYLLMTTPLVRM